MRWILRFRVFIIICLAVVLISAAVVFSVLRAVLPHATGYKNEIQQEVSQQIGLPVEIESIDAAIHWFSPRLKLIGVSVYDEKNKAPLFNFKEAFVELDVIASIIHWDFIVADIGLIGADISIERLSENDWLVQGMKFTSEGSNELPEQFVYMLQNADYLLHDSNINFQDHTGEKLSLNLLDINMDVSNSFNNHKIKFSMNLPDDFGRSLAIVADLSGDLDSLAGEIYIEAQKLKLKQWNQKFNLVPQYKLDTEFDVNLWVTIDDNDISSLVAQLVSRNLSIFNNASKKRWETPYLTTDLRYVKNDKSWNLAVSDFYFGSELKPAWGRPVTVLASGDDESYYLSADFLRFTDLKKLAEAVLPPELKDESEILEDLNAYRLKADLYNLNLQLPRDVMPEELLDNLNLEVSLNDFSMYDPNNNITLKGFDAAIQYDKNQAIVSLQTKDAEVELKELFRRPITAEILQGELVLTHRYDCWQIKTEQLQLKNGHINTFSRLDMQLDADNNIFVDIQTNFYDAYGKYAKHYLPIGIMKPSLVKWLDMAVTDGHVPGGSFILHGDLSSFPYKNHDGVFQVLFSPRNVNMKFLDNWPLLTDMSGTVKFNNMSLTVSNAKAKTQGANLSNGYAVFQDLTKPHLTVKTRAHGENEDMQSYVWSSPLDDILGDAMRLLQFDGSSDLNLTIDVPLDTDSVDVAIDGHLRFSDTAIYYPTLGYEITGINGVVDFTKDSIFADSVIAKVNNRPVSINALTENAEAGRQLVFHLDGIIGADYLLQRYEWIPDDWLSGQAEWSISLEVPYQPKDYLVHVTASSYLEDVVVRMSDKVQKPASEKMRLVADIDVLDSNDLQIKASLRKNDLAEESEGEMVDLFAVRNSSKVWSFDVKSGYLTGKGEFTEGLDKDTQLKLDLEEANVQALFVTEGNNNKNSQPLNPSDFPPLDWKAEKILWGDWVFTDIVLQTGWNKHGMLINTFSLQGPAMSFDARGTWLTAWNGTHETVLEGSLSGSNCGATLVGLGYQQSLARCSYQATFNSKWPAEPYRLSWANMKGKTTFNLKEGEILDVDPGTSGRLLGLLNIFELANRLSFDFDDVTRKGFSFDSINGELEFAGGEGSLKNFDVSAPAADINMFGRIGMVEQDYGLLMRVKPHTDTLTFAGGVLLGGVAVGAGLALIQKVFDLGVIGHNVFSITGTWDEPVIEKIVERNQDTTDEDDF